MGGIRKKHSAISTAKAAPADAGDIWTWTGIDADSKLIVSYLVGARSGQAAIESMDDLRGCLSNRVQLSTDGHRAYLEVVEGAFGGDVDYMRRSSRCAAPRPPQRGDTARPNAPGSRRFAPRATPTKIISARHSRKLRTRRCGCTCTASPTLAGFYLSHAKSKAPS